MRRSQKPAQGRLGCVVRAIRVRMSLTAASLGESIGVTREAVARCEMGRGELGLRRVLKLLVIARGDEEFTPLLLTMCDQLGITGADDAARLHGLAKMLGGIRGMSEDLALKLGGVL